MVRIMVFKTVDRGSSPFTSVLIRVAQLVERRTENPCVSGSSPLPNIFKMTVVYKISVKSFSKKNLTNIISKCQAVCSTFKKIKLISLPSKTKKITILRSPFVNKSARDQFEIKFYKKVMFIHLHLSKNSLFLNFLENNLFKELFKLKLLNLKVSVLKKI